LEHFERCAWAQSEPCLSYHDEEWGVPVRDDRLLFEMLTLEGAQAGLSWETVLKKRAGYRAAFVDFEPRLVSRFGETDVERLMQDGGIIRNRAKILSTINNANRILEIQNSEGSFSDVIWAFVGGKTLQNNWKSTDDLPAQTELSVEMSKTLLKRGFRFVGPTICYSFMQAVGLVNDHTENCFRYNANRSG
jgi:DNA-3-methyladenine glycosylase I